MDAPSGHDPPRRLADRAWSIVVGVSTVLAFGSVLAVAVAARRVDWFAAALAVGYVLGWYWFAMGAWRRTSWGRDADVDAPPAPPVLSEARARQYVTLAALCAVACAVALGVQIVLART